MKNALLMLLLASVPAQAKYDGCSGAQKAAIDTAAGEAMARLWRTKMAYAGIGPAMDKAQEAAIERRRQEAVRVEKTIFGETDADISYYVTRMFTGLMEHSRDVRCAPKTDPECGPMREAYVRSSQRSTIWVCPSYFKAAPEQQVRTIVHEAAHSAGISESSAGESYCVYITCDSGCGGKPGKTADVADNWSAFVHCAAREPADKIEAVTAKP